MWYGSTVTSPHMDIYWGKGVNTFLSIEPILEPFGEIGSALKDSPPKWVIIGAETGKRKNKVKPERKWVEDIVEQCRKTGIPVFMKSSLADIWGEPLIQELPEGLKKGR
nr:MAG TPA: radical SAM mobile pair protein A [Bacteriophage sp.]